MTGAKRRAALGLVASTVALVLAIGTTPAGAAVGLVNEFQGCTTSLTPVQLVGGTGQYTFSSGACSNPVTPLIGCRLAGSDATTTGTGTCTISASGTYANIVCGTGTTGGGPGGTDTATVQGSLSGVGPARSGSVTVKYGIVFVSGIGFLQGKITNETGNLGLAGAEVVGAVQILPTSGNCILPVSQFIATGATLSVN